MSILTVTNISKTYQDRLILDKISLSFEPGESYVIVGRNGAGKSTFLSILAGYLKQDQGSITTTGTLGFVPQQDVLFEDLSTKDNLTFWLKAHQKTWEQITPWLDMFGVSSYLKKRIKNLSGGMKKSVAICCALIDNPDIMVMDEPFAGLDAVYKDQLLQAMAQLKNQGKTLIYTSHNIDELIGLNSQIYGLKSASLVYKGESQNLTTVADLLAIFGE